MRRRDFLISSAAGLTVPLASNRLAHGEPASRGSTTPTEASSPATGPLHRHAKNSRYFADASGRAVLLTGSHMWNNLVDMGAGVPPAKFDFAAYCDFLQRYHHNFIRLWTWECTTWDLRAGKWGGPAALNHVAPHPYARTGPGTALDGKPKFDLTRFDSDYFDRLRSRVTLAGKKGIYVSIMLFEGWNLQFGPGAWQAHPYHPRNNVNQIEDATGKDGHGLKVHELAISAITRRQEAYVRKVIDTVNDLDNVLYEISNENHPASTPWQYHFIDFIHKVEKRKAKQHPVGMTFQYKGGKNQTLLDSPADWISPNPSGGYRDNPPANNGKKVILPDTDHLWGVGGNQAWVWKSFLRGLNPLFMDPYDASVLGTRFDPQWEPIRKSLGYAARFAQQMDLAAMRPRNALASTKYCLANPGIEYLVYAPQGGEFSVDLTAVRRHATASWFDPKQGTLHEGPEVRGGGTRKFQAKWQGDAVLHIKA